MSDWWGAPLTGVHVGATSPCGVGLSAAGGGRSPFFGRLGGRPAGLGRRLFGSRAGRWKGKLEWARCGWAEGKNKASLASLAAEGTATYHWERQ